MKAINEKLLKKTKTRFWSKTYVYNRNWGGWYCVIEKQFDRKREKFSQKEIGPYTVVNISDKGVAKLKNASGVTLNNKYNIVQLKHYTQGADNESKSTSNKDAGNFWNHAPDEIVEMILLDAIQQT